MSDTQELSKQQLKSKETKGRIFRAAKTILQEKGYEALSIKNICEEAEAYPTEVSIIISRQRTIFCPTISRNSPASTRIFWNFLASAEGG